MSDKTKEFVDTNILIYSYDQSSQAKRQRARQIMERLWRERNGCLSVQVMQEFLVTVTQKVPVPLSVEEAEEILEDLSKWDYHVPDAEDIMEAIKIQKRYRISFWDANIINSALQSGCQIIWSEDLNCGQDYHGVEVRNPFK